MLKMCDSLSGLGLHACVRAQQLGVVGAGGGLGSERCCSIAVVYRVCKEDWFNLSAALL